MELHITGKAIESLDKQGYAVMPFASWCASSSCSNTAPSRILRSPDVIPRWSVLE